VQDVALATTILAVYGVETILKNDLFIGVLTNLAQD
jgi:hypothetical protein